MVKLRNQAFQNLNTFASELLKQPSSSTISSISSSTSTQLKNNLSNNNKPEIILITSFHFPSHIITSQDRQASYLLQSTLQSNLNNPYISQIYLYNQIEYNFNKLNNSHKIKQILANSTIKYSDLFKLGNEIFSKKYNQQQISEVKEIELKLERELKGEGGEEGEEGKLNSINKVINQINISPVIIVTTCDIYFDNTLELLSQNYDHFLSYHNNIDNQISQNDWNSSNSNQNLPLISLTAWNLISNSSLYSLSLQLSKQDVWILFHSIPQQITSLLDYTLYTKKIDNRLVHIFQNNGYRYVYVSNFILYCFVFLLYFLFSFFSFTS